MIRHDSADLTRISGTATDGVYRGTFPVQAGTKGFWGLHLRAWDQQGNLTERTSAQLTAAGLTAGFRSTTTAAPATPAKLTGSTGVQLADFGDPIRISGVLTWTLASGSPAVSGYRIDAANASCGTRPMPDSDFAGAYDPALSTIFFSRRTPLVPCRVTLRLANAAGVSGPVTVVFI